MLADPGLEREVVVRSVSPVGVEIVGQLSPEQEGESGAGREDANGGGRRRRGEPGARTSELRRAECREEKESRGDRKKVAGRNLRGKRKHGQVAERKKSHHPGRRARALPLE